MLEKMLAPGARPVGELAKESGISDSTLYSWKAKAASDGGMGSSKKDCRPDDRAVEDKVQVVATASGLVGDELGAFLRREGIHEADLKRWREQIKRGLGQGETGPTRDARADAKRIRELEKELRRKDKALAEAAALLVLKKKALTIWGDEDDDTTGRSGK